jgi:hypothetical protein
MKCVTSARAFALLLLAAVALSNRSTAQTNSLQSTPNATGADQGTNALPVFKWAGTKPLGMSFTDYKGDGHDFELHFNPGPIVWRVPEVGMEVADGYTKTGYIIKKFEQKKSVYATSSGTTQTNDISELTLQHEGEDPIVLVIGVHKEVPEPIVQVFCPSSGETRLVFRSQCFFVCGRVYKLVEIRWGRLTVIDMKSNETITLWMNLPPS